MNLFVQIMFQLIQKLLGNVTLEHQSEHVLTNHVMHQVISSLSQVSGVQNAFIQKFVQKVIALHGLSVGSLQSDLKGF